MDQKQRELRWLLQDKYQGEETPEFKKDVKRLEDGEPLDYIIGFSDFLDCKIDLSKKPLIPRLETEFWADQAIQDIQTKKGNVAVLDMFAGSGCIGIAVLKHVKNTQVTFAEFDKNAVSQIKINGKVNNIPPERYTAIFSDIFKSISGKYDYILANPPYIPTKNRNQVQASAIKHEPHMALFGKEDGLYYIGRFLQEAKKFLNPGGKIYMEFDTPQREQIEVLLRKYGYAAWEFQEDQFGYIRYVKIGV